MGDPRGDELVIHLPVSRLHGGILVRRPIQVAPNPVNPLDRSKEVPVLPSLNGSRKSPVEVLRTITLSLSGGASG